MIDQPLTQVLILLVASVIVVAIARRLGLPIRYIGLGEGSDDFGRFNAGAYAAALLDGGEPGLRS